MVLHLWKILKLKKQTCIYNKRYGKISFIRNRVKIKIVTKWKGEKNEKNNYSKNTGRSYDDMP